MEPNKGRRGISRQSKKGGFSKHSEQYWLSRADANRGVNPERGCRFMMACVGLLLLLTLSTVLYLVLR